MNHKPNWLPGIRSRLLRESFYWVPFSVFLVIVTYILTNSGTSNPPILGPYSIGTVTSRVEGIEEPAVRSGETVDFEIEVCTSGTADVSTDVYLRRIDNGGAHEPEKVLNFTTPRIPQCSTFNLSILIPMRFGTGRFSFFGNDIVLTTGEQKVWSTQTFMVVP